MMAVFYPVGLRANTVYVMVGADTSSVRNTSGGDVAFTYANEFDMTPMSAGVFPTLMSGDYRNARRDSYGQPIVFTWYMLTGGWHHYATNVDAVAATRVYQEYWGEENDRWGDEISLHFHHFTWNGSAWVMAPTFAETIWDFEWSISQLVLDNEVFPVSFRSGWNYMDNPYQQELERWIPFRLEGGRWMSRDVPYHPSFINYQAAGTMRGWEVRHRYLAGLNQATVDQIFQWAADGEDQVTCWWSHQYENGFLNQINNAHTYLTRADARFPGVTFRYVTARDGMRMWQGSTDTEPPPLSIERDGDLLRIHSDPDIFQIAEPYVAARTYDDEYVRVECTLVEPGEWITDEAITGYDRVGVAVCDLMGNAVIEYLDDTSRRWSSQTEFQRMEQDKVDALTGRSDVRLRAGVLTPVLEQTAVDGATPTLNKSYWIAQTFTPTKPDLGEVWFGVEISGGPAQILVELRTVGEGGFPVDTPDGLLASAVATASATGVASVPLAYEPLATDGTQYALVFKRISGSSRIRMMREGTYPGGNLTRAFSLDWIHIPAFDCQFVTIDGIGNVDQSHDAYDASTYVLTSGRFVSQTFAATMESINRVEVDVAAANANESLMVELRRTLPDGGPDLSVGGLIDRQGAAIDGTGAITLETGWEIPPDDRGSLLALTFLSPETGRDSIRLASHSDDMYPAGKQYISTDTTITETPGDMWLRLSEASYHAHGDLTWDFDAGHAAQWIGASIERILPSPNTMISARFAFASSRPALDTAPWTEWRDESSPGLENAPFSRWVRIQTRLETSAGNETPILEALEIRYRRIPESAWAWVLH